MSRYSTRQAARKLGLSLITIQRYIAGKKIPTPPLTRVGAGKFRVWMDRDIEAIRKLLPKIKNGRKTRYQKKRSATGTQQSAKAKKKSQKPRAKSRKH